jgi:hypothetical protein
MTHFKITFAFAAACLACLAESAQAQYGVYPTQSYPATQSYPVQYGYPSVGSGYQSMPCATGQCGLRTTPSAYTAGYATTPCATGNCPTGNCPTGNCPTGACQTICGPNGCTTVCPTSNGQYPAPYGYGNSVGYSNTSNSTVDPRTLPSLNLDQVQTNWNAPSVNQFPSVNQQQQFNLQPNQFRGQRGFGRQRNFAPTGGNQPFPYDPTVQLN